jgi:hypothetical protein
MRWDIDKSLTSLLTNPNTADPSITRVILDRTLWKSYGIELKKSADVGQSCIMIWCIALGYSNQPKLFTYGLTIREAYLKARRVIRTMSPQDLQFHGLYGSKKRKFVKAPKRKEART